MAETALLPFITGDIAATADVTVNTKGGSYTATLKKALRDRLGGMGSQLTGAALQFANGQAIVLLAGAAEGAIASGELRVRQTGRNRFEIELDDDGAEEIDEVTATFLRLKKDQFQKGQLRLSDPMTASDWRAKMDDELTEARKLIASAEAD